MKKDSIDGRAVVFCQNAFNTPEGKTAHGLVRFTERYDVVAVIDAKYAGKDAGEVLDGKKKNIPIYPDFTSAYNELIEKGKEPKNFVVGLAPDGGRLPKSYKSEIKLALQKGLNVDSGLHDFLTKDDEIMKVASENNCRVRDIRKTPDRDELHFFTGDIEKVKCLKLAVLGTDSAIGKRTTSWLLVHAFRELGLKAEMIGTGQTAWLQGAKYSMVMDSCINDFVSGEIEHAVVSAWKEAKPDVIVIEGQGSLMNPAYPGGFEILAAGRPDYIILQHAPKRLEYDGFPGYKLHDIQEQIHALQVISGKPVIAITLNHEGMEKSEIEEACQKITEETGLPCFDVLEYGAKELVTVLKSKINKK
ncbi:DUF1611 domain-containing protein [Namhaeicola litoreus]|uniref:DUF1611 domain-containing protein n=1 Tax=Namhaeicola litoreus TaxID=1052145 RepID=A0ABW3Y1M1_9FLAO